MHIEGTGSSRQKPEQGEATFYVLVGYNSASRFYQQTRQEQDGMKEDMSYAFVFPCAQQNSNPWQFKQISIHMTFILPWANRRSTSQRCQTDGPNCCLQLHTRSAPPPCHSCSLQQSHGNLPPSLKPTGHTACMWLKTLMARTCCYSTADTSPSTVGHAGALLVLMLCCTFQLAHRSHWLL